MNERPPLQPSRQVVVVIFVFVAGDPIFQNSHVEFLLWCAKPSCATKNFIPVSTIVWTQSSHESSAAGAVNVFLNFPDCSSNLLSSSFKKDSRSSDPCWRAIAIRSKSHRVLCCVCPTLLILRASKTNTGKRSRGWAAPVSAEACNPASNMLQLSSRFPNQTMALTKMWSMVMRWPANPQYVGPPARHNVLSFPSSSDIDISTKLSPASSWEALWNSPTLAQSSFVLSRNVPRVQVTSCNRENPARPTRKTSSYPVHQLSRSRQMNLPSNTTASTKRVRVVRQDAQIHRTSFQPKRSSSSKKGNWLPWSYEVEKACPKECRHPLNDLCSSHVPNQSAQPCIQPGYFLLEADFSFQWAQQCLVSVSMRFPAVSPYSPKSKHWSWKKRMCLSIGPRTTKPSDKLLRPRHASNPNHGTEWPQRKQPKLETEVAFSCAISRWVQ